MVKRRKIYLKVKINMGEIYKSLVSKYTDQQIQYLSGTVTYVSFERLQENSINDCIGKKDNETIVGLVIDNDGIKIYIETYG